MVQQHILLALIVFNEIKTWKNGSDHLVMISIPKVARNGQKVPIWSNFEMRPVARQSFISIDSLELF